MSRSTNVNTFTSENLDFLQTTGDYTVNTSQITRSLQLGILRKPRLLSIAEITDFLVNVHLSRTEFETPVQYTKDVTFKGNRKSAPVAPIEATEFVKLFFSFRREINDKMSKGQKI